MKKALMAVILMAALCIGLAAHPAINGWEKMNLKGQVRKLTIWGESSERYYFNDEGLISRLEMFYVAITSETEAWEESQKRVYKFFYDKDDMGRVIRKVATLDDRLDEVTEFFYDAQGNLARSQAALYQGSIPLDLEEGGTVPADTKPDVWVLVWYNPAGERIFELEHKDHQLTSMSIWEYDGRNLLIRESEYRGDPLLLREQSEYEYNWRHLVSKSTQRSGDGLGDVEIHTYEYDSEGRLVREIRPDSSYIVYEYITEGLKTITRIIIFYPDGSYFNDGEKYVIFDEKGNIDEEGYLDVWKYEYLFY